LNSQFMPRILPPLDDRVRPPVRVLFVGINPGIRSAETGHHFAGYSNRFWKLLYDSKLVPEPIGTEDDARLPEWGYGITNVVPRATPGIDTLRPDEYGAGARILKKKVRRWKPEVVVFVGVTLYRVVFASGRPSRSALGCSLTNSKARVSSSCRTPAAATRIIPIRRCSPLSAASARGCEEVSDTSDTGRVGRIQRSELRVAEASARSIFTLDNI